MDFNTDLNKALKYTTDDVKSLLSQIESDPAHQQSHSTLRGIAADALDDASVNGDEDGSLAAQARLLRSDEPIYFWKGLPHNATRQPFRATQFAKAYIRAALNHTPVNADIDPDGVEMGFLGDHYDEDNLHPEVAKELEADALHFFHTNSLHIPAMREGDVAYHFWDIRNRRPERTHYDIPNIQPDSAAHLDRAAIEAGPYQLHTEDDGPEEAGDRRPVHTTIYGSGSSHRWGQPAGLPDHR